jgi:hypothetical protein
MKKLLMVCVGLLLLGGCSSEAPKTEPAKPVVKEPEFVTGSTAMHKMYVHARGWARDAEPYRIESFLTSDWNGKEGKAGAWRAGFASPVGRGMKPYTWVGSNAPGAGDRGITPSPEDNYVPGNASNHIFDIAFLKVDSDKALETALKHGGDKLLEKDPNQPVLYVLDWYGSKNALVWHVIFGENRGEAKLTVMVNASTGEFVRVEK